MEKLHTRWCILSLSSSLSPSLSLSLSLSLPPSYIYIYRSIYVGRRRKVLLKGHTDTLKVE